MNAKIEAVARALCRHDGRDPDQATRQPGGRVGFRTTPTETRDGPALWESYAAEAERFVAAAEALLPLLMPAVPGAPAAPPAPEAKRW